MTFSEAEMKQVRDALVIGRSTAGRMDADDAYAELADALALLDAKPADGRDGLMGLMKKSGLKLLEENAELRNRLGISLDLPLAQALATPQAPETKEKP